MATIEIAKQCGCFRKSTLDATMSFESFEVAKKEAQNMCDFMNESFCQNHYFEPKIESKDKIIIKMSVRER